jgi:small subunit ribosomal protein S16
VAVKIKLKRLGKIRAPYYRIVVADARTKRDGRAIEEIGKYHPKAEPSFIEVNSERAQHWLSVGAQPTDPVRKILEITGDWQKYKGLPGTEGTLRTAEPKPDRKVAYDAALAEGLAESGATTPKSGSKSRAKSGDAPAAKAPRGAKSEGAKSEGAKSEGAKSEGAKSEEHLVKGIVEHPDDVRVDSRGLRRGRVLEVRVHPDDLGKVIGRGGRTAKALRTVIGSLAGSSYVRVDLLDTDEIR